jgi:DHA1 family tetracycline resistance protein-like MFS transporter
LTFIFITMLLDTIGLGIIVPVLPELIMELTGEGLSVAAQYGGWLIFIYALMAFIFSPAIGNLSDRYGRRPVLLLALAALSIDYIIMGFAPTIALLFVGRMLAGIAGATYTTANAFIADISTDENRAQNFGLVGAAFGFGFIIGPAIGGVLGEFGPRIPFFAASAVAFANLIYGYLVLPETLAPENRRPFVFWRANPVGALLQMRAYPVVAALIGVLIFYQIAHDANPATWAYVMREKFDWSDRDVGFSLGFVGISVALVQGVLIRAVIPRLGEELTVYFGLAFGAIGFFGFAFASQGWMIYLWIVPWSMMGLATPALRAIMSRQAPPDAQGELQGAITSMQSLVAIFSPIFMTQLFAIYAVRDAPIYFPGAPFLAAAISVGAGAILAAGVLRNMKIA